jgi:hypothetical protein
MGERVLTRILLAGALLACGAAARAQVSPAEIVNPQLKRAEQAHFQQLIALNRAISAAKFPFSFVLTRFAGLDPKQQAGADKRGLEFIHFDHRVVLKISGNYNAAFNAHMLTPNQRANRVLDDVIVPILHLLPQYLSPQADFEGVGFEISFHARTDTPSYSYEGDEVLTVVFNQADAFQFAKTTQTSERQEMLNRSRVYLDGKSFGLMLGMEHSVPAEELQQEAEAPPAPPTVPAPPSPAPAASAPPSPEAAPAPAVAASQSALNREAPTGLQLPSSQPATAAGPPQGRVLVLAASAATPADADALQKKYQAQLQALDQTGRAHDYFVDYAPPSFAVFHQRVYLQLTMRNPAVFDPHATSIYKRAAQSFDLFLAPRLKSLLARVPDDPAIAGLDVTVLSEFAAHATSSSEAIEYILPLAALRQFADADITNQNLMNQSVVLVNGVRIALDLQKVE